ncbi:hypothetical protein RHMOL_Rhmol05G0084700 [Rhododendron molle]|uniref:Uncharacterized protein n=1 Tax=Rhododendron molle TaxID=49168 RepID=A0ACC0NM05_RHOML|nr:hypothetical protein RHMOL_Rhmol05G0084700 [Rhododendron molle]
MGFSTVTLLFYHGGYISEGPEKKYVGGNVTPLDIDPDLMSYIDFRAVVKELDSEICEMYQKGPHQTMDDGLVGLTSDQTMLDMFAMHKDNSSKVIDIYIHNPMLVQNKTSGEELFTLTKTDPTVQGDDIGDLDDLVDFDDIVDLDKIPTDEGVIPAGPLEDDEDDDSDRDWECGDESGDGSGDESGKGSDGGSDDDNFSGFHSSSEDDKEVEQMLAIKIRKEEEEVSDQSDDQGCLNPEDNSDEGGHKLVEFNKDKDMKNPKLLEGMIFPNVHAFRALLKEFHIREGCEYTYLKNEATRVTVICKEKCGFRLHASLMHGEKSFQIKKINADHCCTTKYMNKYATAKWIADKYIDNLIDEPNKKVKTLKNDVRREWMLDVSRKKIYRVKKVALDKIRGKHEEQYLRIRDYCQILINKNPGSTALLKVERMSCNVFFQRMFICFDAQAKRFLDGCRPFIGLDACFLKGPFGGQLMHAVGRDANNQMYPLCMAIVEAELKDSWVWFLENLIQIIGRPEERGWCFMSDRQKGLIEAFKRLMPTVEHRFCLRHMYANFNKIYKGKEYKDLFWGAASAYTVPEFNEQMTEIYGVHKKAHEWMLQEEKEVWARAYYHSRSKVNRMDNNMSEGKKFKGRLCPNISKSVERKKENARTLNVIYSGVALFEVTSVDKTFVVDIREHTCTRRRWDLFGIPCSHGCAAIIAHKAQPEDYVNEAYTTDTFVRTYNHRIKPIPDKSLWPQTECDPIMPPPSRVPIGRPKKDRRKGEDEPNNLFKTRKHSTTTMCRQCGQFGHNVRTCKTPQDSWVKHKGKYYGKQKARFGGGVPPAGKPKESGSGSVAKGRGTVGKGRGGGRGTGEGRGRGARTGTGTVDKGNGRGTVASGSVAISGSLAIGGTVASGKRKAVDQPQQNQGSKRLVNVGFPVNNQVHHHQGLHQELASLGVEKL